MTRRLQVTPVVRRAGRVAALASLLGGEVALAAAYTARGTGWHFLLHSTLGAGAGLVLATVLATLRTRAASPPGQAVGWAVLGQAVSVTPDVLFAAARVPHRRWMDFFLAHISIHLTPQPLLVTTGAFLVAGWGWWLAAHTYRRGLGVGLAGLAVLVVAGALALAHPLPTRLADYAAVDQAWCGPGHEAAPAQPTASGQPAAARKIPP